MSRSDAGSYASALSAYGMIVRRSIATIVSLSPTEKIAMIAPMFAQQWLMKGGDQSPSDFEEMLQAFDDAGVRFLVVWLERDR